MDETIDSILQYLAARQAENGEFKSLESYPPLHPLGDKGWFYTDPSPFIHANILCALQDINHDPAHHIIQKGCQFIQQHQEWRGFWRFWQHGGATHNVPIDLDDTALCSYILIKNGISVNNRKYLLANRDSQGYFLTWLLPRWQLLKLPILYRYLLKDVKQLQPILASPMLAAADQEPAVAANIILYLGDTKSTKPCIQQILKQLERPQDAPLQYYNDPLVIFYHVSRAYYNGVKSFFPAIALFKNYLPEITAPENPFKQAMLAITVLNFALQDEFPLHNIIQSIIQIASREQWESHIYFVSKDRNFRAGSPELTAALCLEALDKYNKR